MTTNILGEFESQIRNLQFRISGDEMRGIDYEVREMWLIDIENREVEIRSFESDKSATFKLADNLHSIVLPKIPIPVRDLFL